MFLVMSVCGFGSIRSFELLPGLRPKVWLSLTIGYFLLEVQKKPIWCISVAGKGRVDPDDAVDP